MSKDLQPHRPPGGTSTKRHSVTDTQAYWTLTSFGNQVHGSVRKNELLKGFVDFEELPEAEDVDETASAGTAEDGEA